MTFQDKLKELITLFDKWLPDPENNSELQQWIHSAEYLAYSYEFSEKEQIYVDCIIKMYYEQFTHKMNHIIVSNQIHETFKDNMSDIIERKDELENRLVELLQRKQIEQRTPEWYAQMSTIISASELGNLFSTPYQRGKFVISKTLPYQARNQSLAVTSDRMSAFDWGIRFEPVVKQIYEHMYQSIIKELGRLTHPTESRCCASPDGLIYHSIYPERVGRLIEIKCPVTRVIDGTIPKDYYNQMQMQLHVTGLEHCDYVEAVFASKYNQNEQKEGPGCYHGIIALVRYSDFKNGQDFYYIYSPINATSDWEPNIKIDEEIVEFIPWRLLQWSEQVVKKSDDWWLMIQPKIQSFWEDVEKAKRGEFVAPESTRAPKRKKEEACQIIFQKLDEHGNNIILEGSPLKKTFIAPLMEIDDTLVI